jgi:hypothetical protein
VLLTLRNILILEKKLVRRGDKKIGSALQMTFRFLDF